MTHHLTERPAPNGRVFTSPPHPAHRPNARTSADLAAIDARSFAMIARAQIRLEVLNDEPVSPICLQLLQDAIDILKDALDTAADRHADPAAP